MECSLAFGQTFPYKFKKITEKGGLSHASINHMMQDEMGYLWIATAFGLYRYDGKSFDKYSLTPNNPNGLKSTTIHRVYQDSKGNIWVGTQTNGLHRFNPESQSFTHYPFLTQKGLPVDGRVILEDHLGTLFVGTRKRGLCYLDSTLNRVLSISHISGTPKILSSARIYTLMEDRENRLWIGTHKHGIFIWNRDQKIWEHIPSLSKNKALRGDEHIRSLYQDKESSIWVGTEAGLFFWDEKIGAFHRLDLPDYTVPQIGNIYIRSMVEDSYGKLWIGSEDGLYLFQREDSSVVSYLHDPENAYSIKNNGVISLIEDNSRVLWLGLDNGGINYIDERENPFHFLGSNQYRSSKPLDLQMVRGLTQLKNGKFLVGTMKGGLRFCDASYQNCQIFQRTTPGIPPNFNNKIYSTWEDPQGQLWAADEDCEIFQVLPKEEKVVPYTYNPCPAIDSLIDKNLGIDYFDFYQDPGGGLWAFTLTKGQNPGGIYHYLPDQDSFVCWQEVVPNAHLVPSQDIYALLIQENIFWIGTADGLFKLDSQKGSLVHFEENLGDSNSVSTNHVQFLRLDQNGILWVGGPHFLNTLDTHTGEWARHMDPLAWLNEGVKGLEEDHRGNMWICTQQGILKSKNPGEFIPFGPEDGLEPIYKFHMQAGYRNPFSGHIMFGGGSGLIFFHPDSVFENTTPPPVQISRLTKYTYQKKGKSFKQEELYFSDQDQLTLSYLDKILIFEIAVLNYFKRNKNLHKYKLDGFQEDWIHLGTENKFTLTNLDPGKYTLLVKGSNSDGVWNEEATRLEIKILPPWWKSPWAYWGYLLLALATLYFSLLLFRKRETQKSLQLQKEFEIEKLKELDAQRSRFFADISHDFRTPLTLIETPVREQLSRLQEEGRIEFTPASGKDFFTRILRNCANLLKLINQILNLSQLEAGLLSLKASEQDLLSLLQQAHRQFESLADRRNIEFTLEADRQELKAYLDKEKIEMVFQNLLGNSFKFTPQGGKIRIQVFTQAEAVEIHIANSGKSIPQEELSRVFDRFFQGSNKAEDSSQGTGIGLAIVKELVELHKGSILAESPSPELTNFRLRLLLGKAHLGTEEIAVQAAPHRGKEIPISQEQLLLEGPLLDEEKEDREFHVLVAEDEVDMRQLMNEILAPSFKVSFAIDGQEAWEMAKKEIPDLIISDLMMPNLDGNELCQRLKGDLRTSHIPVIVLTAKNEDPARLDSLRQGADIFLTKPFSPEELRLNMSNLLDRQKKIQKYLQRRLFRQSPSQKWHEMKETLGETDQKFIQLLIKVVEENLDNPSFSVEELSKKVGYSRVHLFRKLKAIADTKPLDFIQNIRLAHAAQLLVNEDLGIAEIAYSVGFSSPSHFGDRFRRLYQMTPSTYRKTQKSKLNSPESPI